MFLTARRSTTLVREQKRTSQVPLAALPIVIGCQKLFISLNRSRTFWAAEHQPSFWVCLEFGRDSILGGLVDTRAVQA